MTLTDALGLRRDPARSMPAGLRHVVAAVAAVHGVAHAAGAVAAIDAVDEGTGVSYLGGWLTVTDPSALRVAGIAWAVAAALYVVAATAVWMGLAGWPRVLLIASAVSVGMCVLGLWGAVLGIPVSLALAALAVAGIRGGRRHA
ncbi:MAG: hypothetical protein IT200_07285 [Thermoleophilia bacterium]|nr:hypothetical protein [Thermoleophilia bacterium]